MSTTTKAIHTPTPWIATNDRRGVYEIISDGHMLAQVWQYTYADGDLPAEENARLMAAAPELLAALQECHKIGELLGAGSARDRISAFDGGRMIRQVAQAALAKATGD